ncbi:MAG TPA: hypothetical protein VKR27_07685 [Acidimicrobiales bacterium]|nr:hypothetical protein [Acidimicrobiales bacterium]
MTERRGRVRLVGRVGVGAAALLLATCTLSGCGQSADALGHQACVDVHKSLALYARSQRTEDQARAASERAQALNLLRVALRPAALAGSSSGDWQALMTTLSESNRVPEQKLIPALTAQCS